MLDTISWLIEDSVYVLFGNIIATMLPIPLVDSSPKILQRMIAALFFQEPRQHFLCGTKKC